MKCKYCGTKLKKGIEVCHKCGKVNKNPLESLGKKKIIAGAAVIAVLVIIVVTAACISVFKNDMDVNLIDESSGEYMVVNAPANITLEATLEKGQEANTITVKDINGEEVPVFVETSGQDLTIKAPKGGYEKGEVYTVDLGDKGFFNNEEFSGARKLFLVIERRNANNIEYHDGVYELQENEIRMSENEQLLIDGVYKDGDVVVGDADGDGVYEAYRLKNTSAASGKTSAEFDIPDTDEVYEELDIFYYADVDLSVAEINEDVVEAAIDESGIIEVFTDEVYAAEEAMDSITMDKDGNFKIVIKDPAHPERELILSMGFKDTVLLKCTEEDLIVKNTLDITGGIDFTIKGEKEGEKEEAILRAIEDYVADPDADINSEDFRKQVLTIPVPIAPPVASLNLNLGATANYALSAEFNASLDAEVSFTQMIQLDINAGEVVKKHADVTGDINAEMMLKGEFDAFAGLYLEGEAEITAIAEIGLRADAGPYLEGKGCFVVKGMPDAVETNGYYKIQAGLKVTANVVVDTLITKEKEFELADKNLPLLQYSKYLELNSVGIADTYYYSDSGVRIGTINAKYYNKINGEDVSTAIKEYTLYIDGKKTEVEKGVILQPIDPGTYEFELRWEYEGQKFKHTKNVEIVKFDPWGHFNSACLLSKTFGEIDSKYGLRREGFLSGGVGYVSSNMPFFVAFPTITDAVSSDVCTGISGSMYDFFGLESVCTITELESILNVDINWDEGMQDSYFIQFPWKNGVCMGSIYIEPGELVKPNTLCDLFYKGN